MGELRVDIAPVYFGFVLHKFFHDGDLFNTAWDEMNDINEQIKHL